MPKLFLFKVNLEPVPFYKWSLINDLITILFTIVGYYSNELEVSSTIATIVSVLAVLLLLFLGMSVRKFLSGSLTRRPLPAPGPQTVLRVEGGVSVVSDRHLLGDCVAIYEGAENKPVVPAGVRGSARVLCGELVGRLGTGRDHVSEQVPVELGYL